MFSPSLSQTQTMRQQQQLVPQQLQSLNILLATTAELEQKIDEELLENPTLELIENPTQQLVGNPVETSDMPDDNKDKAAEMAEKDENLAALIELNESYDDYVPPSYAGSGSYTPEDEEHRKFLFDSLVQETTLQELLMMQLRERDDISEHLAITCEEIIGSIDDRGYLQSSLEDIAMSCDRDMEQIKQALSIIQTFDPPGVGGRDLKEVLMLQLERDDRKKSLAYKLVSKHLEELGRNQIPKIAKALHISPGQLYEVIAEIRKLDPFPGSRAAPPATNYVIPEVFIEKNEDNEWTVRTNRDCAPRLRISPYYLNMLKSEEVTKEAKDYIRQKITGSKALLKALTQRESTIERISKSLLKFQSDFFEKGINNLRPLILNQVAEDIGVHETTVSRAIANKYVQTPHGLLPFKSFFSSGLESTGGEMISSVSIKKQIRTLIDGENPQKTLSDKKIADMLKKEGLKVARRTVAKYREELGILPSHMRRSY